LCLGPARHDYRAVPGPPPRHGGPTRAQHEIGPTRCQPVNFSLLRAHPTISYKNRIPPTLTLIPYFFSFSWGRLHCVGATPAAASSATAWRRADRLLVRHCQASSRPPPPPPWPGRTGCLFVRHCQAPSRPPPPPPWTGHAGRRLLPHGQAACRPRLLPHVQNACRLLPLPPQWPQANGICPVARHHRRPPGATSPPKKGRRHAVVGAQSDPMGLMGRRALPCLRPGQHGTRGISAVPGSPPRPGGLTRLDTEVHRACIVPGRVALGRIGLGLS
jgi:hypothetical protein